MSLEEEHNSDLSIMHISDIHRIKNANISNSELVSSLLSDLRKYNNNSPSIRKPDVIIVSGDVIQGLPLNRGTYPGDLLNQYSEAKEFLIELANTFVGGDRSKVIVVPGNHDIDWNMAFSSMEKVNIVKSNVLPSLQLHDSDYRWDWKNLELYKVVSKENYNKKINYFNDFFDDYYKGYDIDCDIDPDFQYAIHPISDDIIIVGFNSCHRNDCFNFSGCISMEAISKCHLRIEEKYQQHKIRIAVWHHDFHGSPLRTDYMDQGAIDLLLDKGFRLGIHGHQHKSETKPFHQFLQNDEKMVIISAGSLTAGKSELPSGYNRQYNILELNLEMRKIRVHIREMVSSGVFSKGRHTFMGGLSFVDFEWSEFKETELINLGSSGGKRLADLEHVEELIHIGKFAVALSIIKTLNMEKEAYIRGLAITCLEGLQQWGKLTEFIESPKNLEEFSSLFKGLLKTSRLEDAEKLLSEDLIQLHFPDNIIGDFKMKINIEKRIRGIR